MPPQDMDNLVTIFELLSKEFMWIGLKQDFLYAYDLLQLNLIEIAKDVHYSNVMQQQCITKLSMM